MIPLHPQHLHNFDYKGRHSYLLTWCCDRRQPHFAQADKVNLVLAQFLRACEETNVAIDAYCFMPDHVHKLVHGISDDADAKAYINKAKQYSGFYFKNAFGEKLWQRYGHDSVLRGADESARVVAYIIENPIRRRLVERVEQYPFTGSPTKPIEQLLQWAYGDHRS